MAWCHFHEKGILMRLGMVGQLGKANVSCAGNGLMLAEHLMSEHSEIKGEGP